MVNTLRKFFEKGILGERFDQEICKEGKHVQNYIFHGFINLYSIPTSIPDGVIGIFHRHNLSGRTTGYSTF